MSFHIVGAYILAVVSIGILASMAARNRRAGWRRERHDALLDMLTAWAAMQADTQNSRAFLPCLGDSASSHSLGLSALGNAVAAHGRGFTPEPASGTPATAENERTPVDLVHQS